MRIPRLRWDDSDDNRRKLQDWKDARAETDERKPWLFPLLVGGAVVVLIGVLVYWYVFAG